MGHANKKSLTYQVQEALSSRLAIGESKHADKRVISASGRKLSDEKIYSWSTFQAYMKHGNYFMTWAKQTHGCKTLAQARQHVNEWLQTRIDAGLSSYTIKLEAAALGKIYDCSTKDFIPTPSRHRSEITRSRGEKGMDRHFSQTKNADLINFCRGTGLRRSELEALRGTQLTQTATGAPAILVTGKGGRERIAPIIGDHAQEIVDRMRSAGDQKVWGKVHSAADVHSYRADYATAIYQAHARPVEEIKGTRIEDPEHHGRYIGAVYHCRGEDAGKCLDREAMYEASLALGHSRVSVVAEHYIRDGE